MTLEEQTRVSQVGIWNINNAGPMGVEHSTLNGTGAPGDSLSVRNDSPQKVNLVATKLIMPALSGTNQLFCLYCYNGSYTPLGANCQ
jgi:hypothetical protein